MTLKKAHHKMFDNMQSKRMPQNFVSGVVNEVPGLVDQCGPLTRWKFSKYLRGLISEKIGIHRLVELLKEMLVRKVNISVKK